jgi:hypothetical protein
LARSSSAENGKGKERGTEVMNTRGIFHASIAITLNTYSHVLPDMQDSAVDAMEAALGTIS